MRLSHFAQLKCFHLRSVQAYTMGSRLKGRTRTSSCRCPNPNLEHLWYGFIWMTSYDFAKWRIILTVNITFHRVFEVSKLQKDSDCATRTSQGHLRWLLWVLKPRRRKKRSQKVAFQNGKAKTRKDEFFGGSFAHIDLTFLSRFHPSALNLLHLLHPFHQVGPDRVGVLRLLAGCCCHHSSPGLVPWMLLMLCWL